MCSAVIPDDWSISAKDAAIHIFGDRCGSREFEHLLKAWNEN